MPMSVDDLRLAHGDLSRQIIGAFYDVYNDVGYGFPEAMHGEAMPEGVGAALGFDRLVMLAAGADSIAAVRCFTGEA